MASFIKKGESIFIPFRNGQSISDSQFKPRMYKTVQAFVKSFPGHYLGNIGVELAEYAEVVRCKDCIGKAHWYKNDYGCTICGLSGLFVVEDRDFCSYGERKDNG